MPQSENTCKPFNFRYLTEWNPNTAKVKPTTIVVSCFLHFNHQILVLQRARKDAQHELWGIPGGKLEKNEDPIAGLKRELQEETKFDYSSHHFQLLGTALSKTPSDGVYGLYVFYTKLIDKPSVIIDLNEHHAYKWVSLEEFEALNLLTAQREAYILVQEPLRALMFHDQFNEGVS